MPKFKVGDLIRLGKKTPEEYQYSVTDHKALCKVIINDVGTRGIKVKVMKHKTKPRYVNKTFHVNEKYFELEKKPIVLKHDDERYIMIQNKKKLIIKEINDNPDYAKCFDNVEGEVNSWSYEKILKYCLN
jgi:hypothetical protein